MDFEKIQVKTETIVRVVISAVVVLNGILVMLGKAPLDLDENSLYTMVSAIVTLIATIWVGWKNNSFSKEAIIADEVMKELKNGIDEDAEMLLDGKEGVDL